jgi:predicted transcriptional regulator
MWHDEVVKPAKAMTIRLSAEQAEELETVASVDDQPVSEIIRAAISAHIAHRKQDEDFQQGLRARIERAQRMLDKSRPSLRANPDEDMVLINVVCFGILTTTPTATVGG